MLGKTDPVASNVRQETTSHVHIVRVSDQMPAHSAIRDQRC